MEKSHHPFIAELEKMTLALIQLEKQIRLSLIPKPYYNSKELSEMLGISNETLQKWRDKNIINYSKIGNVIIYKDLDVRDTLNSHYVKKK